MRAQIGRARIATPRDCGQPNVARDPLNAARTEPNRRLADPFEAFTLRCWARAQLFAAGDLDLHEAVDVLQEFAERLGLVAKLGQDAVQLLMAAAFAPVRSDLVYTQHDVNEVQPDDILIDDDPADDYAGLSSTFAAACRKADAKIGERPELDDIPPGCASAARLQRDYEATSERQRARYGPPEATLQAAAFLVREGDPKRLEDWLLTHSKRERAAIVVHIKNNRGKP
jgi:hypothetical protein